MVITLAEPQCFQRNARQLPRTVSTESMLSWDGKYEIWELNSKGPAFSVPKPWGPQKWLFCSVLQKLRRAPNLYLAQRYYHRA